MCFKQKNSTRKAHYSPRLDKIFHRVEAGERASANKGGFTLVELIVIIALIGIMSIVSIASLKGVQSNTNLKSAQREVAAAIKLAQSYALEGKTQLNPITSNVETPCGYGFLFNTPAKTTYFIYYNFHAAAEASCASQNTKQAYRHFRSSAPVSYRIANFNLPRNVSSIQVNNNDTDVYFTVPNGQVYGSDGGVNLGLPYPAAGKDLTLQYGGASGPKIKVTVGANGAITEQ